VIVDLNLAVVLRVIWHRKLMGHLIFDIESGYFLTGEVCPVIKDDSMREAEVTHNVLPQELDHLLSSDIEKK